MQNKTSVVSLTQRMQILRTSSYKERSHATMQIFSKERDLTPPPPTLGTARAAGPRPRWPESEVLYAGPSQQDLQSTQAEPPQQTALVPCKEYKEQAKEHQDLAS